MHTTHEYDPATCITAGELRALGVPLPDSVPDCGWIPRGSMRMKSLTHAGTQEDIAAGVLRVNIETEFTLPFRWIEVNVAISKDQP